MRMTFRLKLTAIVGAAALAFLLLIVTGSLTANRVEQQLTTIQNRYLPKVELRPHLKGLFDGIRRGLQDSVAAHDLEALAGTRALENTFLDGLAAAHDALDPAEASALRSAMEAYYAAAHDVSKRLIAGETGEALVGAMNDMQAKQARATELLEKTTTFDRSELIEAFAAATQAEVTARRVRLWVSFACLFVVIVLSLWLSRGVLRSLAELTGGLGRFGKGDFDRPIRVTSVDELRDVALQANQMAANLKRLGEERDHADWLKACHAGLAEELRGELQPEEAASRAIRFLARYLDAPAGALYTAGEDLVLRPLGRYAISGPETLPGFRAGEGLVGQAALQEEIMVVADPPADYLRVRSGLGEGPPRAVVLLPLLHFKKVIGVVELAFFKPWSERASELLLSVRETLAIAIEVARARAAVHELLAETQEQARRLGAQEEELRSTNDELQTQQEELRQSNEELAQQAEELEVQRRTLLESNAELEDARRRLELKAGELATISTYKSQFLANMSHELRTPLNSMLLLSNLLAGNEGKNLTAKQVEFSKTIHSAGKDLLALINQVLDLAKVEAGKVELHIEPVPLRLLAEHAESVFGPMVRDKGLAFVVEVAPGLPETIVADRQRVEQVINNLIGNAIKFTERGRISLHIGRPEAGTRFRRIGLRPDRTLAFSVADTGVGIAPEHKERIFAPFEQVDSATDRRYGGTGLGLSIARDLVSLLGGELQLQSTLGEGSTFVCFLPEEREAVAERPPPVEPLAPAAGAALLLIEDDSVFAGILGEVIRRQGLEYLLAPDGRTGLRLAKERRPAGIILDVKLPDIEGWQVMEELRSDPATASIPVHFISAVEGSERGLAMGAVGYLTKPATSADLVRVVDALAPKRSERSCRILVVEDDPATGDSLLKQLIAEHLEVRRAANAHDALKALAEERFDCMILDLSLPDLDGLELLKSLEKQGVPEMPSVIVYTARALTREETRRLEAYTDAIVLKEGPSAERLLNEIRLFVRRLHDGLGSRRKTASPLQRTNVHLEHRKILVVDDDMRTVYALSATLRAKGAEVLVADTGRAALAVLAEQADVDAVLMDIMMPEMDGYEAMRRIRQDARFRALPIIALTAKAMKGDREKCVEAGASDYLRKPIDADRLLAMLDDRFAGKPSDGA